MPTDLHVVLGATGGIGRAVVRELVRRGHAVRAVSRTPIPQGVESLAADVTTADGAKAACAGASVVHHCAQPAYHRWAQEFPALNKAVIAGAAGAKIVFADNLYAYAPADVITEDTPRRPVSRKGAVRLAMARRLLDAHRDGTVRVAIGQASDYYGPGGVGSAAGEPLFGAVLAGRTVRWPGRIDVPHALHHVDDIAAGLVTLGERDEADGRAWILPAAPALTPAEFVARAAAAAGTASRAAATPKAVLQLLGLVNRTVGQLPDIWHQYDRPWVVDDSRFQATFGPHPATGWDAGIAATLDWFRHRTVPTTRP